MLRRGILGLKIENSKDEERVCELCGQKHKMHITTMLKNVDDGIKEPNEMGNRYFEAAYWFCSNEQEYFETDELMKENDQRRKNKETTIRILDKDT